MIKVKAIQRKEEQYKHTIENLIRVKRAHNVKDIIRNAKESAKFGKEAGKFRAPFTSILV